MERDESFSDSETTQRAIYRSIIDGTKVGGYFWQKEYMDLPICGYRLERNKKTSCLAAKIQEKCGENAGKNTEEGISFSENLEALYNAAQTEFRREYQKLYEECLGVEKIIERKRSLRPTKQSLARTIEPQGPFSFLAEDENGNMREFGNLFAFLSHFYLTLKKPQLEEFFSSGTLCGKKVRLSEAQQAFMEEFYGLWQ